VDPTGYITSISEVGATIASIGALSARTFVSLGRFVAAARATSVITGGVSYLATRGSNALEALRNSGIGGINALQRAFEQVANRGTPVTQQMLQSAQSVGSNWTDYMNRLLGVSANSLGIQYHHLLNRAWGLPQSITSSILNIVPTPTAVHTQITALHNSGIAGRGSQLLQQHLMTLLNGGDLSVEKLYQYETQIWSFAMRQGGVKIGMDEALALLKNFVP